MTLLSQYDLIRFRIDHAATVFSSSDTTPPVHCPGTRGAGPAAVPLPAAAGTARVDLVAMTLAGLLRDDPETGVEVALEIEANLPGLACDEQLVIAALVELLANALAATPAGGRIAITVSTVAFGTQTAQRRWMTFRIADTGNGRSGLAAAIAFDPDLSALAGPEVGERLTSALALIRALRGEAVIDWGGRGGSSVSLHLPC